VFLIGFLILGVYIISVFIRIDFQHMIQLTQLLFTWATMPKCNITGIDIIKIKTHDGIVRTLSNVRHVPDLKHNLISLDTLESNGHKYLAKCGILKVSNDIRILLKGLRQGSLCVLQGSTMTNYMKNSLYKTLPYAKFKYHLNSTDVRFA